jgi:thiamine-phosphate pyrophosphorylase
MVYELAERAAALTRDTNTRLLINDRADVAAAAGTDGVHLTTSSLTAAVIRQSLGADLLIGVSTHSLAEAREAMIGDADFVVFGPVFETAGKQIYGAPAGLDKLQEVASALKPFPVLALGGVTSENLNYCLAAGAAGVAGIGLFSRPRDLRDIVRLVQDRGHREL